MEIMTMQAARLHAIGDFRTDEIPVPVPHGQELLVKIGACGICGSDLPRIYQHGTSSHIYPLTSGTSSPAPLSPSVRTPTPRCSANAAASILLSPAAPATPV